jgi:hypothetical protein
MKGRLPDEFRDRTKRFAAESQLWLELLREECGIQHDETEALEAECNELMAIFTTMINRTKGKAES